MADKVLAAWKMPGLFKGVDATAAYNEIFGDGEGHTLSEIVDIARNKKSVIHKCFEWDDKKASEEYRKIQAGRIVRSFVLVKENEKTGECEKTQIRMTEVDSSRENNYHPVKFFMRQKDEYEKLLERAKAELESIRSRYANLIELESVFADIDELLAS